MDFCFEILDIVLFIGSPDIGDFIIVDFEVRSHQNPDSDVEFPAMVEERPLYRLLDHPLGIQRFVLQKHLDISNIVGEGDSSSLVVSSWLQKPDVVLALFLWNFFFSEVIPGQLLVSLLELLEFGGIVLGSYSE
jgi:hypothetical protein